MTQHSSLLITDQEARKDKRLWVTSNFRKGSTYMQDYCV
jgi:hypothetical protein